MICKKCQAPKEQGKRCGECHKRRCRNWHTRFVKAGVPRGVDVFRSPVTGETLLDKSVDNRKLAVKPRKVSAAEQKRIDKNTYERARRARKKVEAASSSRR